MRCKSLTTWLAVSLALCSAATGARAEHTGPLDDEASELPEPAAGDGELLLASRDAHDVSGAEEAKPARSSKHVDLSRFSNGPRRVPRPRGRALARAIELGIGTHEATIKLLRNGASAELRAAVPGERPTTLLWPVPGGHPGRGFGFTRRIRTELRHNGIDIGAEEGTPVRAAEAGLVVYSDNTLAGYGNCVIVLHPGGLMTLYAHNSRTTVQPGWFVERGERIALLGATGYAWGPHLHFELRDGFRPRDPAAMIRGFHSDELAGPLAELEPAAASAEDEPDERPAREPASTSTSDGERIAPSGGTEPAARSFRTLLLPLKGGQVVRPFAARKHAAVALSAPVGAGVRAAVDGLVTYSGPARAADHAPEGAQTIVLQHADGTESMYSAPLTERIDSGAHVLRGQWLGRLASSDGAPCELRFAWYRDRIAIDPGPVLVGR